MPESETVNSGLINSPQLSSSGKRKVRSIKDEAQAKQILSSLFESMRQTQIVNGRIMAKYNAERPYNQRKLEEEGLGGRSNFTTKPLASMIDKVSPRFVEAIQNLKYLTSASLPADVEGSTYKTEKFRAEITKAVRARKGWRILLEDIAQENGMFGYEVVAWLDKYSWFPRAFRQDEVFIPEGTPQNVDSAQLIAVKEVYLPHELFEKVEDREAAEAAGWNVKNTIEAINKAVPENARAAQGDWTRIYEDLRRELSPGCSFMAGASVIPVYSIIVREIDGKVTHWRLGGQETDLKELFVREDRWETMEDCLTFFSFQKGNGKLRGSKGVGRDIYELAGMLDRSRNEVVDRLLLSGKKVFQGAAQALKKFKMRVLGNAILVEEGVNMLEKSFDGNVEGFIQLDVYLTQIVDQLIGTVSPPKLEGEAFRSPEAWKLFASREEENRDSRVARFMAQFCDMMGAITKRMCDSETTEKDAKAFQDLMLKIMSREELDLIAKQPVAGTIAELTPMERQQVVVIATENSGNPLLNQRKLLEEKLTAQVGADFAAKVLLPDNDPTERAEQLRLQQIELSLLAQGQAVPVSPRDNHAIHLEVLQPMLEQVAGAVMGGQTGTNSLEAVAAHANEHMQMAVTAGAKESDFGQLKALLKQVLAGVEQLKQLDAQAQQLSDQGVIPEQPQPTV